MTWRPWIVSALLVIAILVNGVLLVQEKLPGAATGPALTKLDERLRHISYPPTARRKNFKEMGMDDDLANVVANRIDKHQRLQARFVKLLAKQQAKIGDAFCSTTGLPQPYSALRFLVEEENDERRVVHTERLLHFEEQPWFRLAPVQAVYDHVELHGNRRADATLMGIAGILLGREKDVLDDIAPWKGGVFEAWGYQRLQREHPRVQKLVIDYFSLMHYLTELANSPRGICR